MMWAVIRRLIENLYVQHVLSRLVRALRPRTVCIQETPLIPPTTLVYCSRNSS